MRWAITIKINVFFLSESDFKKLALKKLETLFNQISFVLSMYQLSTMLISRKNCVSGIKDLNFFMIAYNMQHNNLFFFPKFFLKFI